jgi:bile acid:Na+ symporter, BASS family
MTLISMIMLALKISIVLSVFALGLNATFADATCLFRNPRDFGRAFLSIYVLMPLLATLLALAFNLHPAVKIALVALAVSPVPPIFPKKALKAGCGEDYSVGLLVGTALLAIAVIPLALEFYERVSGIPLATPARAITMLVFTSVLAPLLVGIAIRSLAPASAERVAHPLAVFATVLLVLTLLPVLFGSIRTILSLVGNGTLLSFAVFALAGYFFGDTLGRPELEKRHALALATATRHPAIAAAIAQANFPQQKLAVPAIVLYLLVSAIITGVASKRRRTGIEPTEESRKMAA